MMKTRGPAIVATLVLSTLTVTGCAAHGPLTTGTPPPPATAGAAPGAPTSSPFGSGVPLGYDCGQLVDAETLAKLDPGLVPASDLISANDSPDQEALALTGTVCAWSDESAAVTLVITASKPDAPTFAALKQKASAGKRDVEFGDAVTAYVADEQLQLFTRDGYWATVESSLLSDPVNVTTMGQLLIEELPAG